MKRLLLFLTCFLTLYGLGRAEKVTFDFTSADGIKKFTDVTLPTSSSTGTSVSGTTFTQEGISITGTKGTNDAVIWLTTTPNTYQYRVYKTGGTVTVSCGEQNKITSIVLSTAAGAFTVSPGTFSNGTWTGESKSVVFTVTTNAQIKTIEVTYETADSSNPPTKAEYKAPFAGQTYTINVGETLNIDRGSVYPSSMVFILGENSILKEDDDNFTLTGVSSGTETVDVMWEGDDDFEEGEASFTVIVNKPITGTTTTAVFYASESYTDDATYKTQMTGSNISGTSTTASVFDSGDISLWIEKKNTNSNSQINGNQVRWYTSDILHLVPNNGATITKVVINMVSGNASAPTPNTGSGSLNSLVYTWTGSTSEDLTFTAGSQIRFTDVAVTYIEAETGELKNANLSFSETECSARMGEEFTAPTLSNPFSVDVTYSSSEEGVATVNASGEVTLIGAGSTTITATFAGNDTYAKDSASYNLIVKPAMPSNVIVDEITATSFGESFGSYGTYTYTSPTTDITYTVYAMKGGSTAAPNIQINTSGNGGLVVTENPDEYEVVRVVVEQTSAAQIDVYANTEVYTGTAQLYSNPIVGDFIGSITTTSGELDDFTNDVYTGWGLRTSSGARYITKITVTYAIAEGVAKKPSLSFTFNGETVTDPVELDWNATEFPTLVLPEGITSATYSSSDTSVAQINASTGEITLQGVKGETTITATTEAVEGQWKAGSVSYTLVVLDPNSTEATFDFTTKDPYGMTTTSSSNTYYYDEISFSENGVTMKVTGKYRSWGSSSYDFRIYTDENSAITIGAPAGYMLETIEFTGSSLNNLSTETGTYTNGIWESNAGEVDTYVVFTPTGTPNIKTITVWYTLDPYFYLMGTMTDNKTANPSYKFSDNGNGIYTLEVATINAYNGGQEQFVIANGNASVVYTGPSSADTDMVAGNTYRDLKQWGNVSEDYYMGLKTTLYNVTLTWDSNENTLSIEGTSGSSNQLEVTVGNDKTVQSGSVSSDNITLYTENTAALIFVHSPENAQVYYAVELNEVQQSARAAAVPENLTWEKAKKSENEDGAYEISLTTGTSGTVYLKYGETEEESSEPTSYNFSVVKSAPTGVAAILGVDEREVEVYNLNGVRMSNDNLQPGIYIVKSGKEVRKVIVK